MKYRIIILSFFSIGYLAGYTYAFTHSHEQKIGPTKSIRASKARYFFVGYSIANHHNGNCQMWTVDGYPPQKNNLAQFLKDASICPQFEYKELVITGLYEFKNKAEADYFFNAQRGNK